MGDEEDRQSVQYDFAAKGTSTANGGWNLPEALGGLDVLDEDEDWLLSDDDVGGCDTLHPPNHASDENVTPLPSSNKSIVLKARLADILVYGDGNFEEVCA
jgi:hypothetical protein